MSLAELMDAEVLIEDLTPGLVFDDERHDPRAPTTRVLLFEARRGAPPRLDGVVEREESWAPPLDVVARPDARWRLLGASDDRVLAEGALALPALCPCGEAGSHIVGDVRYPHESWFRLDLPRHEGQERLELLDAAGDVLGAWILSTPG
ncbi:MAG: hypothetical protein KIT58_09270 [Planctomycetota bacterium]|nr:hypothetical protein [Planctomycetota bacterium]